MPRSLPGDPSVEYLRKEAKDLLRSQRAGERQVCDTLRFLQRFVNSTDGQILAAEVSLHESQFALAMDYGFASWAQLRANADALVFGSDDDRGEHRVVIDGLPHATFDIHWDMPARATAALLAYRGVGASFDEILARGRHHICQAACRRCRG